MSDATNTPTTADSDFDPRWQNAFIPAEHWHFHRQLRARYGLVLGPGEFSRMLRRIASGKALMVERRRAGEIYWVHVRAEGFYVLFAGRMVRTAWPREKRLKVLREQAKAARLVARTGHGEPFDNPPVSD